MSPSRRLFPILVVVLLLPGCLRPRDAGTQATAAGEYLLCFWNVENFFDDKLDGWSDKPDKEYDAWFAKEPEILATKLKHLSSALMELNGGRGPDLLAIAECESQRAAELLRDALNARLTNEADHYTHVLFKDPKGGRHIATAIITRLPVQGNRTQLLGHRQRILEGHIDVDGHELVVIASHWTSRLTEKEGEERKGHGRDDYADKVYGRFRAMYESNPAVDLLVCGDFNDTPEDPSVTKHLKAIADVDTVRGGFEPVLLNLFANKSPEEYGTHYYHRRWHIFDQIVVSPGLLDNKGWTCELDSATRVRTPQKPGDKQGRPWSFGTPKQRGEHGYSDHFPVTVKLRVSSEQ